MKNILRKLRIKSDAIIYGIMTYMNRSERTGMVILAVTIGLFGGLGATGFRFLIQFFQKMFWGGRFTLDLVGQTPWLLKIGIPAVGGLLCGLLIYFFAKEAKGHGVPEVMEAVARRSGIIRARVVVVKAFASALSIASGGSVGREGPIVQIGSALGSTLGQTLKLSGRRLKTLVGCGAAAGIAATFNAPIAGALFAAEVILGDFTVAQFSPIVISSVSATVLARHFMGNVPAFEIPRYELVSAYEFIPYVLLGLLAAFVAVAFNIAIHKSEDIFDKIRMPGYLKTAIGGVIIGCFALSFPQIYGVGYETITEVLLGNSVGLLLAALIVFKILATSITLGSGGSGGIFAPSLFIGAMLGGFIGGEAHQLFPGVTATSGAYALVGMGAVVAAATHAPLSAIIILFELTGSYQIIPALMVACTISTLLAMKLKRESIYTMKLARRGIDLAAGKDINILKNLSVRSVVNKSVETIPCEARLPEIVERMTQSHHQDFYVIDAVRMLSGHISMNDLGLLFKEGKDLNTLLIAEDIAVMDVTPVFLSDNLDFVMHQFGCQNVDELPVVSQDHPGQFIGTIKQRDVVEAYNYQIFKHDLAGGMHSLVSSMTSERKVEIADGHHLVEIDLPHGFPGKSIRELDIRNRFGVQILLINNTVAGTEALSKRPGTFPTPDYIFQTGDRLLVMANSGSLEAFRRNRPR